MFKRPETEPWPVAPVRGLVPDTLGSYLATLGLLAVANARWPEARLCWQNEEPLLVRGPAKLAELADWLCRVSAENRWTQYERNWPTIKAEKENGKTKAKPAGVKKKEAWGVRLWRASATEGALAVLDAHLVAGETLAFNPLLGSGGNAGKRMFDDGWARARDDARSLAAGDCLPFLDGQTCRALGDYNAGSWFMAANKTFNSGLSGPYRNGEVSPWAMLLACEGLWLLQGSVSRRLGARRGRLGAFPFTVQAAGAVAAGQCETAIGEVWLPLWGRPMALGEVRLTVQRGRAACGARGAVKAAAFASAILRRGVDAGAQEFRRFLLVHTTSGNTFESALAAAVPVSGEWDRARADAISILLDFRNSLPQDRKKVFRGLQGPLDEALGKYAEAPGSARACVLIDAVVAALQKLDRNRLLRRRGVMLRMLPWRWATELAPEHSPATPEMRIALALASLGGGSRQIPFACYLFGLEPHGRRLLMPKDAPLRRVWARGADFAGNCTAALRARLAESAKASAALPAPLASRFRCAWEDVRALLVGGLDESEIETWLFRFALFAAGAQLPLPDSQDLALEPDDAALAFLQPLFSPESTSGRVLGAASRLQSAGVEPTLHFAERAYRAARVPLLRRVPPLSFHDPHRLLAALLAPSVRAPTRFRAFLDPVLLRKETVL